MLKAYRPLRLFTDIGAACVWLESMPPAE